MSIITDILQAISIGLVIATFLHNTGRGLKAIDVCQECLIFLNNKVLKGEGELFNLINICIYQTIFMAYCLIPDYTKALMYGRELLELLYCSCSKKKEVTNLTIAMAEICKQQYRYEEAKELYENAIKIVTEMGDKKGEAILYGNLGTMFLSLSEYDKAKEYLEKALAIRIQIGDKKGKAADYANLGIVFLSLGEYDKAKEYLEKALAITI